MFAKLTLPMTSTITPIRRWRQLRLSRKGFYLLRATFLLFQALGSHGLRTPIPRSTALTEKHAEFRHKPRIVARLRLPHTFVQSGSCSMAVTMVHDDVSGSQRTSRSTASCKPSPRTLELPFHLLGPKYLHMLCSRSYQSTTRQSHLSPT